MYSADCGLADSWTHGLAPEIFCGLNASFFADVKQLLNKMIHESTKRESMSPQFVEYIRPQTAHACSCVEGKTMETGNEY